jgi:putative tricarboxylic transport membrane protein
MLRKVAAHDFVPPGDVSWPLAGGRLLTTAAWLIAIVMWLNAPPAAAQPPRPECIAPAKPGGGFDLTCRLAQSGLAAVLDKPMQVTFMPRGVGAVAFALFNTTRTADENAIVAFSTGSLLNIVTGKFGHWTEEDIRFVATIGTDFGAVIVRGDSEYRALAALMDELKRSPGSLVIGAGGSVGSQDWMKAALLMRSAGQDPRKMRYVSFDGGGEAATALLGGHIDVYAGDVGEMQAHLGDGKFLILAVLSDARLESPFQDIPTAAEQGYDVVWRIVRGFYVGRDVSADQYQFWVDAFGQAFESPKFISMQRGLGLMPFNLAGPTLQQAIASQVAEMRRLAFEMGLLQ